MRFEESDVVELKSIVTEEIKKEVIAFANTKGGKIYIGVGDDGAVLGVENTDACMQQVANMLRDAIKPDITMFVGYATEVYDDKQVVVLDVGVGSARPYYLAKKGLRPEGVYVRQGTTSVPASDSAIRHMIRATDGIVFEQERSLQQELTFKAMEAEFAKRKVPLANPQFQTLGLINNAKIYTNLSLLLADQNPTNIKVALFQDTTPLIFRDRKEFKGSLLQQLNDVYAYLDYNNQLGAKIEGLYRVDKRDYPPVALREALLNCVVHRDYGLSASTIISIFADRIEFVSIGGLVEGITLEDVLGGVSMCRNPKLAHIFYRLELIEAYGTGLYKIKAGYKDEAVQPEFRITPNSFKVILPNVNFKRKENVMTAVPTVHEESLHNIYGQETAVLQFLKKHEYITRRDIEEMLHMPPASAVRLLKKMLEQERISKVGQGRNIRYVGKIEIR